MYSLDLTQKERALFDLLITIPPDLQAAEALLQKETYTVDEVSRVGLEYVDNSCYEVGDLIAADHICYDNEFLPNLLSSHIREVIALLLRYGLNPNGIYEDENIMHSLTYVDNEYLAADVLEMLLSHGGDHHLTVDGEILFPALDEWMAYHFTEPVNTPGIGAIVHQWMVLVGYGALTTPNEYIQLFREFDSDTLFDMRKLKHHRNYYFGVTRYEGKLFLSIYDKADLWEVMRVTCL